VGKLFVPEKHRLDLLEGKFTRVLKVSTLCASGKKPYTVYAFSCKPYPTFLVAGHLVHNCSHHHLPFYGKAHIAYLPKRWIAGLSKFARVVDHFSKKPTVQEELTAEVADYLQQRVKAVTMMVMMVASHGCLAHRGAEQPDHQTITHAIRGRVIPHLKSEFLELLRCTT